MQWLYKRSIDGNMWEYKLNRKVICISRVENSKLHKCDVGGRLEKFKTFIWLHFVRLIKKIIQNFVQLFSQ